MATRIVIWFVGHPIVLELDHTPVIPETILVGESHIVYGKEKAVSLAGREICICGRISNCFIKGFGSLPEYCYRWP